MEHAQSKAVDALGHLPDLNFSDFISSASKISENTGILKSGFGNNTQNFYRDRIKEFKFDNLGAIVDIGAGYGRWSLFLAEVNDRVALVEPSADHLEIAKRLAAKCSLSNLEYHNTTAEKLPFEDNTFDGAWTCAVFYLVNRDKVLSELARVIKSGGRLMFGSLNGPGTKLLQVFQGIALGGIHHARAQKGLQGLRRQVSDPRPNNYITTATVDDIIGQHGFKIDRSVPFWDGTVETEIGRAYSHLFEDMPALADRIETDAKFREEIAPHAAQIAQSIDYNFWFAAIRE